MGRRRYQDKPMDMRPEMMEHRAKKYVSDYKGWQCPDCYAYVRPGEDVCPVCGSMPAVDYGSGGSASSSDNDGCGVGWFIFFFLAPINYKLVLSEFYSSDIALLFVLPIAAMLISCIVGLRKIWIYHFGSYDLYMKHRPIINTSLYSVFVRGWVLYYTLRTAWVIFVELYMYYM